MMDATRESAAENKIAVSSFEIAPFFVSVVTSTECHRIDSHYKFAENELSIEPTFSLTVLGCFSLKVLGCLIVKTLGYLILCRNYDTPRKFPQKGRL